MADMPEEIQRTYKSFALLCSQHGVSFVGMLVANDPPIIYAIGNCPERGRDLARLFRMYADVIDRKADEGLIETQDAEPIDRTKLN
jgi:hypothetical protein